MQQSDSKSGCVKPDLPPLVYSYPTLEVFDTCTLHCTSQEASIVVEFPSALIAGCLYMFYRLIAWSCET